MISKKQLMVLDFLENKDWTHGLELVRISNGRLKKGSIYSHLYALDEIGLIQKRVAKRCINAIGPERIEYQISQRGAEALRITRALCAIIGKRQSKAKK